MDIHFRNAEGEKGTIRVDDVDSPHEAILLVQEALVESGEGYNVVLAVSEGGKK